MKTITCVLAILAAASTAAVAGDLKQDKKATVGAGTESAVTAGSNVQALGLGTTPSGVTPGQGTITAPGNPFP
jgi:hypothetical protein